MKPLRYIAQAVVNNGLKHWPVSSPTRGPRNLVMDNVIIAALISAVGVVVAALIAILRPPRVTSHPANQTRDVGQQVIFRADADGVPAPATRWLVSTDHGCTFASIAGVTGDTYTFTAEANQNENQYRAVFTNWLGRATTHPARLTVTLPVILPVILPKAPCRYFLCNTDRRKPERESVMMERRYAAAWETFR